VLGYGGGNGCKNRAAAGRIKWIAVLVSLLHSITVKQQRLSAVYPGGLSDL
jgi:hypothetical protein